MQIEFEDLPAGFFGTGNWDSVELNCRLFTINSRGNLMGGRPGPKRTGKAASPYERLKKWRSNPAVKATQNAKRRAKRAAKRAQVAHEAAPGTPHHPA